MGGGGAINSDALISLVSRGKAGGGLAWSASGVVTAPAPQAAAAPSFPTREKAFTSGWLQLEASSSRLRTFDMCVPSPRCEPAHTCRIEETSEISLSGECLDRLEETCEVNGSGMPLATGVARAKRTKWVRKTEMSEISY